MTKLAEFESFFLIKLADSENRQFGASASTSDVPVPRAVVADTLDPMIFLQLCKGALDDRQRTFQDGGDFRLRSLWMIL